MRISFKKQLFASNHSLYFSIRSSIHLLLQFSRRVGWIIGVMVEHSFSFLGEEDVVGYSYVIGRSFEDFLLGQLKFI